MQIVNFRDGTLLFRLPKDWIAQYKPDGGAEFRSSRGEGLLVLNVLEFDAPDPVTPNHGFDLLANYGGHEGREILQLNNGNTLVAYRENAQGVTAFAWDVVIPVPPSTLRLAGFSYFVPESGSDTPEIEQVVSMLTAEIAKVTTRTTSQSQPHE